MSSSGMISFSPAAARASPSPARAGTSSQPEIGPIIQPLSLQILRSTQGWMSCYTICRPALQCPAGSMVATYSSPPAIGFPVFDPSRIGSEYATPPSYQAVRHHPCIIANHSTGIVHHSHWQRSHSSPVDPAQSAEAPQAPQPRRTTREVRPPTCGIGGHMHPPGGEH
ncbi:hypothetical protein PIB30_092054 [Stylosanthes scabra]|uniref:Uncharacterized protein n=1 Tax=Stylosanthes scabra TaxID=79078 RepID=A0ABU6SX72_9FABA|nr:hypothetical protein [Stylosanthes scabra]